MTSAELRGCGFGGVSGQEGLAVDPAAATELPLPSRGVGSTCSSRRRRVGTASRWVGWRAVGDRGRPCAPRTAMSSRSLRSVPSGLEENAVVDRKVRSRRRRPDRIGRAQRLRGRGRAGLRGQGSGWLGGSARGLGVPGASRPAPLSRWATPRDSGHAVDTGGAVCATVVGIARKQGGSAWSP